MKAARRHRRHRRNAAPGDFVPNGLEPIDFRYDDPPEQNGLQVRYGAFQHGEQGSGIDEEPRQWYEVSGAGGSDYSGNNVTRANYNTLEEMLEEAHPSGQSPAVWATAYGGHGTYAIIVVWAELDESIQETLNALDEYSLISDDEHSRIESEARDEAWASWASSAFQQAFLSAWNRHWGIDRTDEEIDSWPDDLDDATRTLFEAAADASNTYWVDESEGQWIDVKRVVDKAVALLAGTVAVPSHISPDEWSQLLDLAEALGMERSSPGATQFRRTQQRLPGIKN